MSHVHSPLGIALVVSATLAGCRSAAPEPPTVQQELVVKRLVVEGYNGRRAVIEDLGDGPCIKLYGNRGSDEPTLVLGALPDSRDGTGLWIADTGHRTIAELRLDGSNWGTIAMLRFGGPVGTDTEDYAMLQGGRTVRSQLVIMDTRPPEISGPDTGIETGRGWMLDAAGLSEVRAWRPDQARQESAQEDGGGSR